MTCHDAKVEADSDGENTIRLCCPRCESVDLYSIESLPVFYPIGAYRPDPNKLEPDLDDDEPEAEPEPEDSVVYVYTGGRKSLTWPDDAKLTDNAYCHKCQWEGPMDDLTPLPAKERRTDA